MITTVRPTTTQWRTIRFEVLQRIESLPSLHAVVVEFLSLAGADFFSAKDFENILRKDQALVARLLKVANSGLYGRARAVASIPEAVVLIGLENLKKIVYAVSAENLIRNDLAHYDYHDNQGFWHHAMGVAATTRIVAEASPTCGLHGEEGFVAGLLHDVGKLVLDDFLELEPGHAVTLEHEKDAVGLDHAELGGHILNLWNLPEGITATVRHHHDYRSAGRWVGAAGALALARGICGTWGIGRQVAVDLSELVPYSHFQPLMDDLAIPASRWDTIIWDVRQNLVKVEEIFGMS